jgi:hypothetical protein
MKECRECGYEEELNEDGLCEECAAELIPVQHDPRHPAMNSRERHDYRCEAAEPLLGKYTSSFVYDTSEMTDHNWWNLMNLLSRFVVDEKVHEY